MKKFMYYIFPHFASRTYAQAAFNLFAQVAINTIYKSYSFSIF